MVTKISFRYRREFQTRLGRYGSTYAERARETTGHTTRRGGRDSVEIDAVRLDDYFEGIADKIDFIKMDIQGAEAAALEGMRNLLQTNRDVKMVTEFWPHGLRDSGADPEAFLKALVQLGFTLYRIDEQRQEVRATDAAELLGEYVPARKNFANLLCKRER